MDSKPIRGHVEDATEEGFAKLLVEANRAYVQGLTLVGIVNIGTKRIGGVFVRQRGPGNAPGNPLTDEF